MKKLNLIAALVLLSGITFGQTWNVDKAHAKLGFGITHLMISEVDGSFKAFEATITSSKDDLSDAVFDISADIASVNTDNEHRDADIKGANYFDAEKFPKMTFKSTSFKKGEGNKYKMTGDLTLKGVTKSIEMEVIVNGPIERKGRDGVAKKVIGLKVSGSIKRTDFGVGSSGGAMLSEEVMIIANGEFSK